MPRPSTPTPKTTTRRRFIAGSGVVLSAPLVLAACGAEEAGESSAAENAAALNVVLAAQLATADAVATALEVAPPEQALPTFERLAENREASIEQLEDFIAEAEGEPTTTADETPDAESAVEGAVRQLELAIAAGIDAVREISVNPYRQAVTGHIVEDAAALAHLRSILGEEPAPDSFVFGPPAGDEQGAPE